MNIEELKTLIQNEGSSNIYYDIKGYKCVAIRHTLGFWCGYVYIPTEYENVDIISHIQAHGKLTQKQHTKDNIIVGFECCATGDINPYLHLNMFDFNIENLKYRDVSFVKQEFELIIDQLIDGKFKIRAAKLNLLIE